MRDVDNQQYPENEQPTRSDVLRSLEEVGFSRKDALANLLAGNSDEVYKTLGEKHNAIVAKSAYTPRELVYTLVNDASVAVQMRRGDMMHSEFNFRAFEDPDPMKKVVRILEGYGINPNEPGELENIGGKLLDLKNSLMSDDTASGSK